MKTIIEIIIFLVWSYICFSFGVKVGWRSAISAVLFGTGGKGE